MQALIPLTAASVPLIITPGLLFHFDITPKVALLVYSVAVLLARPRTVRASLTFLWSTRTGRCYTAVLALQLVSFAISTALSVDPLLSIDGSEWRRLGFYSFMALVLFTIFAAGWLRTETNVRLLLWFCAVSTLLIASYGIAQYFGLDLFLPAAAYHAGEGPYTIVRPPGTLGHADYLASFLVFAVFTSFTLSRVSQAGWQRFLPLVAGVLASIAIVLAGTRGGLLGLGAGLLTLLVCGGARVRWQHFPAGLVLILVAAGFVFSPVGAKLRARVHWSTEDPFGGARLLLWRDSVRMIASRPLAGFGPETFIREFPRFQSPELARAYPDFFHESPHNILLDATVSQGIPGGILLGGAWTAAMWAGIRALRQRHRLAPPLIAAGVGLIVSHQFIVFVPATALVFCLSQALLVTLLPPVSADVNEKAIRVTRQAWIVAVPAIAVAIVLAVYGTRLLVADRALDLVRQRTASGNIIGAVQAHETVARWQPRGGSAELYYSRGMAAAASQAMPAENRACALKEALEAGARAVSSSEQRANAWYSLATLFAAQGDSESVERALRIAIAWAPNWFKPHWTLAQLLHLQGRNQEAMAEAVAAVDRNGGKNPEVLATWLALANQLRQ